MSSTEHAAARFAGIEDWPTADLASALLETQLAAVSAAAGAQAALAQAIDAAAERLTKGGRLIYLGAGTSGRLAVLDAAELPPTFNWPPERAIALMAGGPGAVVNAVEGAEDSVTEAPAALKALNLGPLDVVIGVAASGRTPYVRAGLAAAKAIGALTLSITNAPEAPLATEADIALTAATGAEIIAGSTRMKAGTAQKVLLNCLSTGIMIRLGFVYRGRMIEMRPTNVKLHARAVAMIADLTGESLEAAEKALKAGGDIKTAVAMLMLTLDAEAATARLTATGGKLSAALKD